MTGQPATREQIVKRIAEIHAELGFWRRAIWMRDLCEVAMLYRMRNERP